VSGSLRKLLGFARGNAIALLALFLALTAGAYAATVPKDSVVSSSIKNGQVRAQDLARDAVTGKAFKVKANKATTHDGDPCINAETGTFCGYDDGSSVDGRIVNTGTGLAPVTYSLDKAGIVRLSGTAGVTSYQASTDLFILPKSMRPKYEHVYGVPCGQVSLDSTCMIEIHRTGRVTRGSGTTPFAGLALDSITFRAGS
jgi:hypothetical protein